MRCDLTSKTPRVIAIIPAFNEEGRVGQVIRRIPRDVIDEIIVVDDHSTDSTAKESLWAGGSVVSQCGPHGVGAAIKAGYREGLRRGGGVFIVVAGDMQHDPSEMPRFLRAIQDDRADYVTGNRLGSEPVFHGMPPLRYVGNTLLSFLTRLVTGIDVRDSQCGFTAITRAALERIDIAWLSDSWGITNTLLAECRRNRLRVKSVPVSTRYGARTSYIRLHTYVPWIIWQLIRALFRIGKVACPGSHWLSYGKVLHRHAGAPSDIPN